MRPRDLGEQPPAEGVTEYLVPPRRAYAVPSWWPTTPVDRAQVLGAVAHMATVYMGGTR